MEKYTVFRLFALSYARFIASTNVGQTAITLKEIELQ